MNIFKEEDFERFPEVHLIIDFIKLNVRLTYQQIMDYWLLHNRYYTGFCCVTGSEVTSLQTGLRYKFEIRIDERGNAFMHIYELTIFDSLMEFQINKNTEIPVSMTINENLN